MPTVHVMPVGDLLLHASSDDCFCNPETRPVLEDNDVVAFIELHNALDGRREDEGLYEEKVEGVASPQEASQGD